MARNITGLERLKISLVLAGAVLAAGTVGYWVIEGWDLLDSLYMTAITVTTVGFGEVHPMDASGRIFTIVLMAVGVGTVFYILSSVTQMVVEGELKHLMGRRSLLRQIKALKGHYIICGYGRIGALIYQILHEAGAQVVVIEKNDKLTRQLDEEGAYYVLGSATDEETLLNAGIEKAKALVATVASDADNLYITLTAKGLNPDIFVIARASDPASERTLRRAGADKVVSPYFIGARRIAQMLLRPSVADFIDLTFHSGDQALQMEELVVAPYTELDGVSLKDSGIRQKLDVIVLAIKRPDGKMIFNPPADTVVQAGDTIIALGPRESMRRLGKILAHES